MKKNWKKSWKNVENRLFSTFFWRFSTFFQIFFQHFFSSFFLGFLRSARTKQNFILIVKSQFPKWFGLQKGKRNMQKTTFGPPKCCIIANGAIYHISKWVNNTFFVIGTWSVVNLVICTPERSWSTQSSKMLSPKFRILCSSLKY